MTKNQEYADPVSAKELQMALDLKFIEAGHMKAKLQVMDLLSDIFESYRKQTMSEEASSVLSKVISEIGIRTGHLTFNTVVKKTQ